MDFLKKNLFSIVILFIIIILFFARNPFGCVKPIGPTITTKTDTVREYITQAPVFIPQYIPQSTSTQPVINIPSQYLPPNDMGKLLEQYKRVLDSFLAINNYKDSIILKDSTGKQVGVVNIEDQVSQNHIISRKPNYHLKFPTTTITNTTTIVKPYIPKNKWFFISGITGNSRQFVNGANIGIGWLNKKDQFYYIKGGFQTVPSQVPVSQFEIGTAFKIKF